MRRPEDEAVDTFPDNPCAGDDQEERFPERGEILDLAVSVGVIAVRGFFGDAHCEVGHQRRKKVQTGVRRFRQEAQAVCFQSDDQFQHGDEDRGEHRVARNTPLFVVGVRCDRRFRIQYHGVVATSYGSRRNRIRRASFS